CDSRPACTYAARTTRVERVEDAAGKRLGIEVGALGRHPLAAKRNRKDVVDAGLSEQKGHVGPATIHGGNGILGVTRVRDPLEPVPIDELRVELALIAADELDT